VCQHSTCQKRHLCLPHFSLDDSIIPKKLESQQADRDLLRFQHPMQSSVRSSIAQHTMLALAVLATLCALIDAQNVNLQVRSLPFTWW
jgi:hypothetical protein